MVTTTLMPQSYTPKKWDLLGLHGISDSRVASRITVVMDVWEHAYLLDYKPADRPKYLESFFANVDCEKVEQRLKPAKPGV